MKEQIEKQAIEEMAKLACTVFGGNCHNCSFNFYPPCPPKGSAERIYNAGYRKQMEGEWIWKSNGYMNALHCSLCNKTAELHHNFCPNCGAKMKGGAG